MTVSASADNRVVHEVWAKNFAEEFAALETAALKESHEDDGYTLALDMEFPGFVCEEPRTGAEEVRYQAVRMNVDRLRPIQLGVAVADPSGSVCGVWSFNLKFDVERDEHTKKSVAFLRAAGIDFPRHAAEGIEASTLGRRLAESVLVGQHSHSPCWVTFSGSYDFGYLLKLMTFNHPLPRDVDTFNLALSAFCPWRHDLRGELPHGSLDALARRHGVLRRGAAHTAGSDALLTLELCLRVVGKPSGADSRWAPSQTDANWDLHQNKWYSQGWDLGWDSRWAASAWSFPFPGLPSPSPLPPPWWLASALWSTYHHPSLAHGGLSHHHAAAAITHPSTRLGPWGTPDMQRVTV